MPETGYVGAVKPQSDGSRPRSASRLLRDSEYRPELQGLRALALWLVVLYHVWFGRVSGGVDVFLFVSAFLLTLSFTRKVEAESPLAIFSYWARVFKRLVPAAAVVLIGTGVGSFLFLPEDRWQTVIDQIYASLLYVENWALAFASVDYYAQDHSGASPLQHFWSLSVQGQIFILWPLVFLVCASVAKAMRLRPRPLLVLVFSMIFVASLAFSIWQTEVNQTFAYFDTRTRLWEFALGSLVALTIPYLRLGRLARLTLGWIGVLAIVVCGFVIPVEQQFPGYLALWPTLAAACVLVAGTTGSRIGVDRFLGSKPVVKLGDMSYSLYLWHWPILVIFLASDGSASAGFLSGTLIILASVLLAALTTRWVEKPVREWRWSNKRPQRAVAVVALSMALGAIPALTWQLYVDARAAEAAAQSEANNPGARALAPGFTYEGDPDPQVIPLLDQLNKQWGPSGGRCEGEWLPSNLELVDHCYQFEPTSDPQKTVLVVGDSHMQQWNGAIHPVAQNEGWRVISLVRGGCSFGDKRPTADSWCNERNENALDYILEHKPDAVFTVSTKAAAGTTGETIVEGYEPAVRKITSAAIPVVGIRDNPRLNFHPPTCISKKGAEHPDCNPAREDLVPAVPAHEPLADVPGLELIDMTDRICAPDICPIIVGNVLVFMDEHHVTRTYMGTLADEFGRRVIAALGWGT